MPATSPRSRATAYPRGGEPAVRELVIRSADGSSSVTRRVAVRRRPRLLAGLAGLDTGRAQADLRAAQPDSHARSLYQVNADGSGLSLLLPFDGTIEALRYSRDGQLAMLAVESPAKEVGAVEAGCREPAIWTVHRPSNASRCSSRTAALDLTAEPVCLRIRLDAGRSRLRGHRGGRRRRSKLVGGEAVRLRSRPAARRACCSRRRTRNNSWRRQ